MWQHDGLTSKQMDKLSPTQNGRGSMVRHITLEVDCFSFIFLEGRFIFGRLAQALAQVYDILNHFVCSHAWRSTKELHPTSPWYPRTTSVPTLILQSGSISLWLTNTIKKLYLLGKNQNWKKGHNNFCHFSNFIACFPTRIQLQEERCNNRLYPLWLLGFSCCLVLLSDLRGAVAGWSVMTGRHYRRRATA